MVSIPRACPPCAGLHSHEMGGLLSFDRVVDAALSVFFCIRGNKLSCSDTLFGTPLISELQVLLSLCVVSNASVELVTQQGKSVFSSSVKPLYYRKESELTV